MVLSLQMPQKKHISCWGPYEPQYYSTCLEAVSAPIKGILSKTQQHSSFKYKLTHNVSGSIWDHIKMFQIRLHLSQRYR